MFDSNIISASGGSHSNIDSGFSWEWNSKPLNTLIARFMGPTWGPSGADRTMLAPWTLLSGHWIEALSTPVLVCSRISTDIIFCNTVNQIIYWSPIHVSNHLTFNVYSHGALFHTNYNSVASTGFEYKYGDGFVRLLSNLWIFINILEMLIW